MLQVGDHRVGEWRVSIGSGSLCSDEPPGEAEQRKWRRAESEARVRDLTNRGSLNDPERVPQLVLVGSLTIPIFSVSLAWADVRPLPLSVVPLGSLFTVWTW